MAENTPQDKRLEDMKHRLHDELVDEHGRPAEPDQVDRVVDSKAESLAGAPVQEFIPLLIEHEARDELRHHGLHRDFGDETTDVNGSDERIDDSDDSAPSDSRPE